MDPDAVERKLAAILSADVVGYSRLMAEDEEGTVRRLKQYREVIDGLIATYHGRLFGAAGDSVIAEFASAVDAVRCAVEIQQKVAEGNAGLPDDRRMRFRIGVNLGDVVVEGENLLGDGVNIAARLQALADPDGICISGTIYDQIRRKLDLGYEDLGEQSVKNIPEPVRVYALRLEGGIRRRRHPARRKRNRLRVALATFAGLILLVGVGLWATWPRPLGLLIDILGVSGPPINPPLPDLPSIVVLPFTNMSGDPEQEYFSDGITEDLTTDLSGIPYLFVIARNSAFTYKGKPVKVEEVGRELGVRYVLEGSVRRSGDRVRITAQLLDATTGFHVWGERYDRDLADIFALQSEISLEILAALGVEIREAELERIRRKPTEDLTAYDLLLKGIFHFYRTTREGNAHARHLFEQAIKLDPDYAEAHAMLGATYSADFSNGWNLDPKLLDHAEERLQRALALSRSSPTPHTGLAILNMLRGQPAAAVAAFDRAIELGPSYAVPHFFRGFTLAQQGKFVGAVQSINRALRLNPRPPPMFLVVIAAVNFVAGRTQEAVEMYGQARAASPDLITARLGLAYLYESEGRHEEARAMVQEILRLNPHSTAYHAAQLSGGATAPEQTMALRRAGLP